MSAHPSLPAVAVSIEDGHGTVLLEPYTAMPAETQGALLACDTVRVFINATTAARPGLPPLRYVDYDADTMQFLLDHTTLICGMVMDCGVDASPVDIEKCFASFDTEEVENSKWAIRFFTDKLLDFGEYIAMYRPVAAAHQSVPPRGAAERTPH